MGTKQDPDPDRKEYASGWKVVERLEKTGCHKLK